jgi:chromosome segregation ATPase
MVAMLVGFLPAGLLGAEITSQGILRHFSMALGATALGLVFRILVLQGGRSLDQITAEIETDLLRYAREVSAQAREIGDELNQAREDLHNHRKAIHALITQDLTDTVLQAFNPLKQSASEISGVLAKQANSVAESAAKVQQALADSAAKLEQATDLRATADTEVSNTVGAIHTSLASFQSAIDGLRESLTRTGTKAGTEIEELARALGSATEAAPRVAAAAEALSASLSETEASFGTLKSNGEELSQRFKDELDTNGRLLKDLETAQERVTEKLQAAGETAERAITTQSEVVQTALVEHREKLRTDLDSHRTTSQGLASRFSTDLDRVSERLAGALNDLAVKVDQARQLAR